MASQTYVDGVTLTAAAEFNLFDSAAYAVLSGVAGTNTITATGPATYSYAATRPPVWFIPAVTNTGATTINVTPSGGAALGAKNVFFNGAACVGGELVAGVPTAAIYDGTQLHIVAQGFRARSPTLGTEQATTSGTSIDFTGIPSWAKVIVVMFNGVSTSGTESWLIQLGDAGGVETSGYLSACTAVAGTVVTTNVTAGFEVCNFGSATLIMSGSVTITMENAAANTWTSAGVLARSDAVGLCPSAGRKSTSAALDRVRITTASGTDTFDAGAINILYW